jgi:xylan 1,4-beta-xylosidase
MVSSILFTLAFAALTSTYVMGLGEFPDCANGPLAKNLVCDSTAAPGARAAALVAIMTVEEKMANLVE